MIFGLLFEDILDPLPGLFDVALDLVDATRIFELRVARGAAESLLHLPLRDERTGAKVASEAHRAPHVVVGPTGLHAGVVYLEAPRGSSTIRC